MPIIPHAFPAHAKLTTFAIMPAHLVNEDQFDQKYFKEQREIIIDAYSAVRTIRLMFANHPRVKIEEIEIPDWLQEGKIWTM